MAPGESNHAIAPHDSCFLEELAYKSKQTKMLAARTAEFAPTTSMRVRDGRGAFLTLSTKIFRALTNDSGPLI
jgi:hypothetical protein